MPIQQQRLVLVLAAWQKNLKKSGKHHRPMNLLNRHHIRDDIERRICEREGWVLVQVLHHATCSASVCFQLCFTHAENSQALLLIVLRKMGHPAWAKVKNVWIGFQSFLVVVRDGTNCKFVNVKYSYPWVFIKNQIWTLVLATKFVRREGEFGRPAHILKYRFRCSFSCHFGEYTSETHMTRGLQIGAKCADCYLSA